MLSTPKADLIASCTYCTVLIVKNNNILLVFNCIVFILEPFIELKKWKDSRFLRSDSRSNSDNVIINLIIIIYK